MRYHEGRISDPEFEHSHTPLFANEMMNSDQVRNDGLDRGFVHVATAGNVEIRYKLTKAVCFPVRFDIDLGHGNPYQLTA
jgi:hypothetical protein